MSPIKVPSKGRAMPFALRPLQGSDIHQSAEIEREVFPTQFPHTSFRRELKRSTAGYLVAQRRDEPTNNAGPTDPLLSQPKGNRSSTLVGTLLQTAQNIWNGHHNGPEEGPDFIAGFLGTWYMVDEAHIVSVAVRRMYRGHGIGELLLIGAIERAMAHRSSVVTLEVRASNEVAKNLYRKYGFQECGVRKGYYADDREDAIIMTTDPIHLPPYPDLFQELKRAHRRRWGQAERKLS